MLLVDSRIGSKDLLEPIQKRVNGNARSATLNSADVAFEGNGPNGACSIGIERKVIGDMLSSMRSGRYAGDQLIKMSEDYSLCYLIVEGLFRPSEDGLIETWAYGGWAPLNLRSKEQKERGRRDYYTYAELDKFLDSVELQKNVMVKRSSNRLETVWQIVNLYNYFQKSWDAHVSTEAIKTQVGIVTRRASLVRLVAAQLPGIGWGRSREVEKIFPTVETMVSALPTEWEQIPGIGKKTAATVWGALRGRNGS